MADDLTTYTARRWPDQIRGPWTVRCHWRSVAGRVELVGMEVYAARPTEPRVLSAATWRQVYGVVAAERESVAALFATAARQQSLRLTKAQRKAAQQVADDLTHSPRRQYGQDHYDEVARVYSEARRAGRHDASAAVARSLNGTPDQARKWVARARQLGLLPPAEGPRRAGPAAAQPRQPRQAKSKPPAPAAPTARKGRKA